MRKPATKPFDRMPRVGDRVVARMSNRYAVPVEIDPDGWDVFSDEKVGKVRSIGQSATPGLALIYYEATDDEEFSSVEFWNVGKCQWEFGNIEDCPQLILSLDPEPINNFIATLRAREDYVRRMVL